jgi:C4-dicarboxylate transporter, DctM subunit
VSGVEIGLIAIALMIAGIFFGVQVGIALMGVSFVSIWMLKSPEIAARMVGAAANDALRDYLFGVVPLFVLMGMLVSVSGIGRDTFDVFGWLLRRLTGGLGVATVIANAVFAAVTGVSIASASVFTKVAVPEMVRHGYSARFACGIVAGSSILGMLIPPSLLMIVYSILAEESVGRMFIAGIVPGILMTIAFSLLILGLFRWAPAMVGNVRSAATDLAPESLVSAVRKLVPITVLILLVIGGIYGGLFTPTEAGAVGALGALVIALVRHSLTWRGFWEVLLETGQVSVAVLFLVLAASLYSRMLTLTGLPAAFTELLGQMGLGSYGFLAVYVGLVVLLGCIIDSISIMLIVLPIVLPVAHAFSMDIIWFGVVTVVAVEIGLITPPFGLGVFTVKSALNNPDITVKDIFIGAWPFVIAMMLVLIVLIMFPALSTYLARL